MNCFQRAWRSLCRKPMKSALLFCVVLVISLLLLCGFSARTATIATGRWRQLFAGSECGKPRPAAGGSEREDRRTRRNGRRRASGKTHGEWPGNVADLDRQQL